MKHSFMLHFFAVTFFGNLSGTGNRQTVFIHIACDGRTGGNHTVFANGQRRNQIAVATNKRLIFDIRLMFQFPIVIDRDTSATEIDFAAAKTFPK